MLSCEEKASRISSSCLMKNAFNPPLGHALFLFHLALSVFPDIGSVGQVEKKKNP